MNYTLNDEKINLSDLKIDDRRAFLSEDDINKKIAYYQNLSDDNLFSDMKVTIVTTGGKFVDEKGNNLKIGDINIAPINDVKHDQKQYNQIQEITNFPIIAVYNNTGKIEDINYEKPKPKPKSNRGRKPNPIVKKPKNNRCGKGAFPSQTTFEVVETKFSDQKNPKVFKIKVFTKGIFQVPGVQHGDLKDLIQPIEALRKALCVILGKKVFVSNLKITMKNFSSHLNNTSLYFNLPVLKKCIEMEKKDKNIKKYINIMTRNADDSDKKIIENLLSRWNPFCISECLLLKDIKSSLDVKFKRTHRSKEQSNFTYDEGKLCLGVQIRGKFSIKTPGCEPEAREIYSWFGYIVSKYRNQVLINPNTIRSDTYPDEDTDCEGYSSHYENDEYESSSDSDEGTDERNIIITSNIPYNQLGRIVKNVVKNRMNKINKQYSS